jgi:hypothetical protein
VPSNSNDDVRQYVRALKLLYKEAFISAGIFLICVVAWMTSGGVFWPLWVLIGFMVKLFVSAISIGLVDEKAVFGRFTSFFGAEWEARQIERYAKVLAGREPKSGANADGAGAQVAGAHAPGAQVAGGQVAGGQVAGIQAQGAQVAGTQAPAAEAKPDTSSAASSCCGGKRECECYGHHGKRDAVTETDAGDRVVASSSVDHAH